MEYTYLSEEKAMKSYYFLKMETDNHGRGQKGRGEERRRVEKNYGAIKTRKKRKKVSLVLNLPVLFSCLSNQSYIKQIQTLESQEHYSQFIT